MAFDINAKQSRENTAIGAAQGAGQGAVAGATMGAAGGVYGAAIGAAIGAVAGGIRGGTMANVQDRKAQKDAYLAEQRQERLKRRATFDAGVNAQPIATERPLMEAMGAGNGSAADAWRAQVYGA